MSQHMASPLQTRVIRRRQNVSSSRSSTERCTVSSTHVPSKAITLARGTELWQRLVALDARLRRRGVRSCPLLTSEAGACEQGCTEAAACGVPYVHAPSTELPLEFACPYHY